MCPYHAVNMEVVELDAIMELWRLLDTHLDMQRMEGVGAHAGRD